MLCSFIVACGIPFGYVCSCVMYHYVGLSYSHQIGSTVFLSKICYLTSVDKEQRQAKQQMRKGGDLLLKLILMSILCVHSWFYGVSHTKLLVFWSIVH